MNKKTFEITDILMNKQTLENRAYFPKDLADEMRGSNAILIPEENYRGLTHPIFPEHTLDFFEFLKENATEDFKPSICISDEDYVELELHNPDVNLATIFVTLINFPIITNLISHYLIKLFEKRRTKINAKINIIVEVDKESKRIQYEGSADDFQKSMKSVEKLLED